MPAQLRTSEVVASIARVTDHTDREMLEYSLLETLIGLLNLERVEFYAMVNADGERAARLTCWAVADQVTLVGPLDPKCLFRINELPGFSEVLTDKDVWTAPASEHPREAHHASSLYPLVNQHSEVVSVLAIQHAGVEEGQPDVDTVRMFVAGFLKIYENYLRLLDDAEHDPLTGLLNRRSFDRSLQRVLLERPVVHGNTVSGTASDRRRATSEQNWLAVIDVDKFKRINDEFGHVYGDEILLLLADQMRAGFRSCDSLFRIGGEEFVVVLRAVNVEAAGNALERFRKQVAGHAFPQVGTVTVSIGFAELAGTGIPSMILDRADDALYFAKEHGRNRLCSYERLLASGDLQARAGDDKVGEVELF